MRNKRPSVKDEKLKKKRCRRTGRRGSPIAPVPRADGGTQSGSESSGSSPSQGGTTAQKKAAGRKGGTITARKRSS